MSRFLRRVSLPAPAAEAFAWHARAGALERLTPPWEPVRVESRSGGIEDGARVVLRIGVGPATLRWVAEHRGHVAGVRFRDVQVSGPFARWEHTHSFEPADSTSCLLEDRIEYALPAGAAGAALAGHLVRARLARMFDYRHRVTAEDLRAHARYGRGQPMQVLVSGASGLIGSALVPLLTTGGHEVVRLVRRRPRRGEAAVEWDPERGVKDASRLEGLDAVVHLAGEGVAEGRWTVERKSRIRLSRVHGTRLLAEALAGLKRPPRVLVSASAIGVYGDRGDETLEERSSPGLGFLAEVGQDWEAAATPAAAAGVRVVLPRFGIVLSPRGGALARMLLPFRLGAGGRVGSGRQWMSWVALDDAVTAVLHALATPGLSGPVNVVAPEPVTNAEFARTLARVLGRPALAPVPAFAARLAFGEMADALLLASQRVAPARLLATGFEFRQPRLEPALRHLLGRPARSGAEVA